MVTTMNQIYDISKLKKLKCIRQPDLHSRPAGDDGAGGLVFIQIVPPAMLEITLIYSCKSLINSSIQKLIISHTFRIQVTLYLMIQCINIKLEYLSNISHTYHWSTLATSKNYIKMKNTNLMFIKSIFPVFFFISVIYMVSLLTTFIKSCQNY